MDVGPKIAVLAEEDVEEDPDRWCSSTECGRSPLANCLSMGVEPAPDPWKDECRELSYARWSGHLPKKRLPSW
jgi:hypothetical protein